MAIRDLLGFEIGSVVEFDSTTSVTANSTVFRSPGSYSALIASGGNGVMGFYNSSYISLRHYVYFPVTPTSTKVTHLTVRDAANAALGTLFMQNGKISISAPGATETAQGGTTMVSGQWYRIALEWQASTASNGIFRVWIDGVLECEITTHTATANMNSIQLFGVGSSSGINVDDIVIDDTNRIGVSDDGYVFSLRPNGDSTLTGFTGTFADIDDTPINTLTNVVSNASPANSIFDFTTTTLGSNTIRANGSVLIAYALRSGGAGTTHLLQYKKGGGNLITFAVSPGTGYTTLKAPITSANTPANQSELDGFQGGFFNNGARNITIAEMWYSFDVILNTIRKRFVIVVL